jgi:hypothetical protein
MLIAIGYLFFGSLSLWYGLTLHKSRRKVGGWDRVNGRITCREVSLSTRAGFASPPGFRYETLVKYEYGVGGKTYEGDRVYPLGWSTNSYKNRKKFLDKIPDDPIVHYDPANPSKSCLFPPSLGWIILAYALGTAIVLLGAGLLLAKLI